MMQRPLIGFLGLVLTLAAPAPWGSLGQESSSVPSAQFRRPVAAVLLADGQTLCVANQRSGTLALVDLSRGEVRDEVKVADHLADLAALPDHRHLLTVDDEKNELIALDCDGSGINVTARRPVGPYPVSVAVARGGTRVTVAGQWSCRLDVVDLDGLRVLHTVHLPFPPRLQCVLPGGERVVVADAFAGRLAVVDVATGQLVVPQELPGHNCRGLTLSTDGRELLVAHQLIDQKAPTTRENIRQGLLMANVLRRVPLDRLTSASPGLDAACPVLRFGSVGEGAADPAGVLLGPDGQTAVALAGVGQVALVGADGRSVQRIAVGRRPTAIVRGPGGQFVVLNTFDDSLSLLDPVRGAVTRTISLGPQPPPNFRDRGELLFYDARLSADGWMSCHSCHPDGHTNGLLADTLGDNTYGTPKRALTLLNTRMTDPWGWNGEVKYLHDQVEKSLTETMHGPPLGPRPMGDLESFLHSLPPPPPPEPVSDDPADRAQVERGRQLFGEWGCVNCHIPPLTYSSHGVYDVGFEDERGMRKFNPPSLRGVGQGCRFLHDNRAGRLEEVFTKFGHQVGTDVDRRDLADLLRFLRSL